MTDRQTAMATETLADPIVWFADVSLADVPHVGGKGANLGELTRAGLPVPPGFVVTAEAYLEAMDAAGVRARLLERSSSVDVDDPEALAEAAAELRELVQSAGLPAPLYERLLAAYAGLGRPPVAVRSSATAEDTASTSFAGMNE